MNPCIFRIALYLLCTMSLYVGSGPIASAQSPETDGGVWAFEETFDGDPAAPSQSLLPRSFDYVVTHRTHPKEHFRVFDSYLADHAENCAGPDPQLQPLPQHNVITNHESSGTNPDPSFYMCKNHMMSSMGDVEGYSVSSFWPRQAFDFTDCGILEFDVNINDDHPRSWWEILITPREQLKVGPAPEWLPIDERYPEDRIVFSFMDNKQRVEVGTGALDPEGVLVREGDFESWAGRFPDDPANTDRRIRRKMRMVFTDSQIVWSIAQEDGTFHEQAVDVPEGFPFTNGLVLFKTHAYTPEKDGNVNNYTFHWDNIRFSGPVVGQYDAYEAESVVYLQANGSRPIGESTTTSITLPSEAVSQLQQDSDSEPSLFGQVHNPLRGQVLLSVNGQPSFEVHPYDYDEPDCSSAGWTSFQLPLEATNLQAGENHFTWTIGPRPSCVPEWKWDGFSIKSLEIQVDVEPSTGSTTTLPPGAQLIYNRQLNQCVVRQFTYLPVAWTQ